MLALCPFTNETALTSTEELIPARLKAGDTVGLISTGFRVNEPEAMKFAIERLEGLGLKVKLGKFVWGNEAYFPAKDEERTNDINQMFADPEVKAIFELRGGWGSNRVLPYLNYNLIKNNPKILIGFSDITSLLLAIHAKTRLVTFYGTMGKLPWPEFTVNYLKAVLFEGEKTTFENLHEADIKKDIIQTKYRIHTITPGVAQGKLIGGNLTLITSLLGTQYLPDFKGAILFIEDINIDYYAFDRMMSQLQLSGVLNQISGFIFGQCEGCGVNNSLGNLGSYSLGEILNHYIKSLGIPAWYGSMIGHGAEMFTLPEGVIVKINAELGTITLLHAAVK